MDSCREVGSPALKGSHTLVKREIARRGDKKALEIMCDGFYLTRGYHANNALGTIHDVKLGKIVAFAHRSKRGLGSNWVGTSGGAEGDVFEELLTGLKDEHFNVKECTINHDATCANVLLEQFPEAEVIHCGNHTIKTFHSDLANIKKISCQVRQFFIRYQCLFFSQRTLTTNIRDIISLLFSSVNMRYRCSEYY